MSATDSDLLGRPLVKICGGTHEARTALLVKRAASLVKEGADPARILLAAPSAIGTDELARQLAAALDGDERAAAVAVMPALALCSAVVERARTLGLTERYGRVMPAEEYLFVLEDLKTLGQKNQRLHNMLAFFRAQWSNLAPEGEWVIAGEESTVIALLRQLLAQYGGGLRDEVPALAARLLEEAGRATLGVDYDYVLCDDFQNLSRAEQAALSLCCAKQLMVAGDENQVTKGATAYPHPQGFADFERVRRGAVAIDLADEGRDGKLTRRVMWDAPKQELGNLAALVRSWERSAPEARADEVVVAVPTRFWGRQVVRALTAAGLPVDDAGLGAALGGDPRGAGCHENLTAYAKLLLAAEPEGALSWRIWGGMDHALTHSDLWREVRRRAEQDGVSPYEAFRALAEAAIAGEPVPFAQDAAALWQGGRAVIEQSRGLAGPALLEALGIAPDSPVATLTGPMGADDDAAALRDRVRAALVTPRFNGNVGAVRVALYEHAAGLAAPCVLLPGLVNGLIPHRDAFDIVKDPDRRATILAEETARLRAAADVGRVRVASSFAQADVEVAERAKMRVERISSQNGQRMARLAASCVAHEAGLAGEAQAGSAGAIETLFATR